MNIEELNKLITNAEYLDENDKRDFLEMIPKMNKKQITELATLVLWAEEEKNDFNFNRDLIIASMTAAFNAMNETAQKNAIKPTMEIAQDIQKEKDKTNMDELMNQLKDA